ncbi:hypothetical protein, partial [Brasilonema sp. UFV-L1]|uniref:hypothetical protein n=1 Tax=Brasilonema sp. UFV-L1 TaxID=2234130 RepID=UPI001B7CFA7E
PQLSHYEFWTLEDLGLAIAKSESHLRLKQTLFKQPLSSTLSKIKNSVFFIRQQPRLFAKYFFHIIDDHSPFKKYNYRPTKVSAIASAWRKKWILSS